MLSTLRAEFLKLRRLRVLPIVALVGVGLPVMVVAILRTTLARAARQQRAEMPWQSGVIGDATVLAILALPMLVVLTTALLFFVEHHNHMWKQLRTTPRSLVAIYAAKFAIIQSVILASLALALATSVVAWTILPDTVRLVLPVTDGEVRYFLVSVITELYIALLPVSLIQFALSARLPNVLHPVGVGLGLTIANLLFWSDANVVWFPYAYPGAVVIHRFGESQDASRSVQLVDTTYHAPRLAFGQHTAGRGVILVDHAHENRHTLAGDASGSLGWISEPAEAAGFSIHRITSAWTGEVLRNGALLVVAGIAERDDRGAISENEVNSVVDWVRAGGSLLLLTDHDPYAEATRALARRLGVELSGGIMYDPEHSDGRLPRSNRIVFSRTNGLIGAHPITAGVRQVITYGGEAVWGGDASIARVLMLAPTARNLALGAVLSKALASKRAQLVAFTYGKGRVVVSGETALFTAQMKEDGSVVGVGDPLTDNGRLAINTFRWLLRADQ